ncbi:hypothetical protein Q2358_25250, partial [Escherichia coli]|nr:hypothetical protein [Escherichia coli]
AGQGGNLGFLDAAEVIAELKRLHRQGKDIGQYIYLRRYERRRKHSAALILAGMPGMVFINILRCRRTLTLRMRVLRCVLQKT